MPPADVKVVVPWRGGCLWRERAWEYVRGRLERRATVVEAEFRGGTWSKAQAVMPVVASLSENDIVVVHDADVWCDGLDHAVEAVREGWTWAMPHGFVHRLTPDATTVFMGIHYGDDFALEEAPYLGVSGGGIVVARRDAILDVPLDPRFRGWGQEDESWGVAMTIELDTHWRGQSPLYHLWHPPQPRMSRRRGSQESYDLRRRYFNARYEPGAMRAILEEAKDAL